ncbi:helix-turn-helix transcriptional regulator [Alkalimarinus coralli]|uniref:helix-turn-helix transcriptional regulator n=1 Tax=Alkalimarinus coralli TaxID=2935863 RepID=UPI00202B3277|nr:WYL domain-containing protein [Alkalimarinus coralli]
MKKKMDDLRKKQFIEVVMQWDGELSANMLQRYFSLSRATAQKLITRYQAEYPDNAFDYNKSTKRHTPTDMFNPQLTQGTLNEYLSFFGEGVTAGDSDMNKNSTHLELLTPPLRNINPKLVRRIIQACNQSQRLDIEYLSLSSGDIEGRIISPHTLVNDGIRWHVRAYCEKNRQYRDFVLSRFVADPVFEEAAEYTREHDTDWNTWLTIILTPDPRLSDIKQHCIALDYMMVNRRLEIKCRAALVKYLLQRLRVDTYHHKPEGQQIIVESGCWEALAPYRMT